ncbi:hypothetical protein DFH29DRAFT_1009364 [Suillus ampliporus]|nr:hypothetical protein DFH29DRAFT_1009364 [Suillus ampliporus]
MAPQSASGSTDNVKDRVTKKQRWHASLSDDKRAELKEKDRLRKQVERARKRAKAEAQTKGSATPSNDDVSHDVGMDEAHTDEMDITIGVLGRQVPARSGTIKWKDGRTSVLPAVYEDGVNILEKTDVAFVKYYASFPESTPSSAHVLHLTSDDAQGDDILEKIGSALRNNKPVVIRGTGKYSANEITAKQLDLKYGISPETPLTAHDCRARVLDPVNPHQPCTIDSFLANMNDPTKIQCILDLPWMHGGLPRRLRNLDHGLRCGWGGTTRECPIYLAVHSGELRQQVLGYAPFSGIRYKSSPRRRRSLHLGRAPLQGHNDVAELSHEPPSSPNSAGMQKSSPSFQGDILCMGCIPRCNHSLQVVTSTTTSRFILQEISRYLDATKAQFLTNQTHAYSYALETLRRMVIAVPHLSRRIPLYRRPLIALCLMVLKCINYISSDAAERSVSASDTEALAEEISNSILACLKFKSVGAATTALYKDDQYVPGELVDREELHQHLAQFRPPVA